MDVNARQDELAKNNRAVVNAEKKAAKLGSNCLSNPDWGDNKNNSESNGYTGSVWSV